MKKKRIASLLQNNINLLGYHLPLDFHAELGNNQQLGQVLELNNIKTVYEEKSIHPMKRLYCEGLKLNHV